MFRPMGPLALQKRLGAPENQDVKKRAFMLGGRKAWLVYIDGMASEQFLTEFVLRHAPETPPGPPRGWDDLLTSFIAVTGATPAKDEDALLYSILDGQAALFVMGVMQVLLLDVRGYEKRPVGPPSGENVVLGAQEGFVENQRTNITLIRRQLRSPDLIAKIVRVGGQSKVNVCLLYMKGAADEGLVQSIEEKLAAIDTDVPAGAGFVEQLLVDKPLSLLPHTCMTERPDRSASFLREGQVVLLVEGAPYAIALPVTFFHLMNTPDDTFMRWQYGTFIRIVRYIALVFALFLPAFYLALVTYHQELIPLELLMSIARARADVPFSVLAEVLIMDFAFWLVDQSGTRIPRILGGALGIFGALILGQAAADAKIVSPLMIIVVALSSLGSYAIPNYSLARTVQIMQLVYIFAAVLGGFFALSCAIFVTFVYACASESFGVPFFAPLAPRQRANPDLFIRWPLYKQKDTSSMLRRRKKVRP